MACKKLIKRVAWKKIVIIVHNIYINMIKRVKTKVEKVKRTLEQVKAAELKKENIKIAAYKKL